MCLAVPGKVLEIDRTTTPVMGNVSFGGVQKQVCLEWLPDVGVGDYVIVHVGFAISRVDEKDALETLELYRQMGEGLQEGDGSSPGEGEDRPTSPLSKKYAERDRDKS